MCFEIERSPDIELGRNTQIEKVAPKSGMGDVLNSFGLKITYLQIYLKPLLDFVLIFAMRKNLYVDGRLVFTTHILNFVRVYVSVDLYIRSYEMTGNSHIF